MSREMFIEKSFTAPSLERINQANEIMEEYASNGYDLTLRQLYYQFVSRDLIPNIWHTVIENPYGKTNLPVSKYG